MAAQAAGAAFCSSQPRELDLPSLPFSPRSPMEATPTTNPPSIQTIPTPDPSIIDRSCPLSLIPPDIVQHRNTLFALDAPIALSPWAWDAYWPYIDNVWSLHAKPGSRIPSVKNGYVRVHGACRLWRKRREGHRHPDDGVGLDGGEDSDENGNRDMSLRPTRKVHFIENAGTCPAKFRMTLYEDGHRTVERTSVEGHNHTLDDGDALKRNSGIRGLLLEPFFSGWDHTSILAYLRDGAGATRNYGDLFVQAGGLYLDRKEVTNVLMRGKPRRLPPGTSIGPTSYIQSQMEKYKGLLMCNFRGCQAPPFPDMRTVREHRKDAHGLRSHDHSGKRFVCLVRGCERRKRSKGFVSREGLVTHMREKHGWIEEAMMHDAGDGDGDGDAGGYSDMDGGFQADANYEDDDEGENDEEGRTRIEQNMHYMLTADSRMQEPDSPVTPASLTASETTRHTEVQYSLEQASVSNLVGGVPRTLTAAMRRRMQARIQKLIARRDKLDEEIASLHAVINEADSVQHGGRQGQGG